MDKVVVSQHYQGRLLFLDGLRGVAAIGVILQYLSGAPSILPVAWTLCIELQLYLALMLLLMLGSWFINKFHLSSLLESRAFPVFFGLFALFCMLCKIHVITLFAGFGNALFIHFWHQFFLGSLVCWTVYKGVSEKYLLAFRLFLRRYS